MKDFLIKDSSHIVIYGQTSLYKQWENLYEFYYIRSSRRLDYLSINKKDALIESESTDNEVIFHKLVSHLNKLTNPTVLIDKPPDQLKLIKGDGWALKSTSKYVDIDLTNMEVEFEPDCLKLSNIIEGSSIVIRVKDTRIIKQIDHKEKLIVLNPLYPSIPKPKLNEVDELLKEDEDDSRRI